MKAVFQGFFFLYPINSKNNNSEVQRFYHIKKPVQNTVSYYKLLHVLQYALGNNSVFDGTIVFLLYGNSPVSPGAFALLASSRVSCVSACENPAKKFNSLKGIWKAHFKTDRVVAPFAKYLGNTLH